MRCMFCRQEKAERYLEPAFCGHQCKGGCDIPDWLRFTKVDGHTPRYRIVHRGLVWLMTPKSVMPMNDLMVYLEQASALGVDYKLPKNEDDAREIIDDLLDSDTAVHDVTAKVNERLAVLSERIQGLKDEEAELLRTFDEFLKFHKLLNDVEAEQ